ncbi:hypothetical protein EJG51_006040 [Undibacterium piscinae]|uniref:PAS domain-containing protein n=1 Tax=Undibacterium piscinae TaxID=2495591 RepID=A0A6M4A2A0_9BURK|nr:hypothetical protein EJG51_006040 [Undibacterium piscinae]
MRINTPVTQIEYIFKDGESIVSTTDLSGNINYCQPLVFIEASGYQEHELLGRTQNILRHPDMPAEASPICGRHQEWPAMVGHGQKPPQKR